jgi:hypothetical protein
MRAPVDTIPTPAAGRDVAGIASGWLKERAPQVNHSARILFQELRQRGYQGGYDTVKLAVRPLRLQATLADLTQCR